MERGDSLHSSVVGITTAIYPIVGQEELENPPPLNQPFNETQRNNWTICTIFYDGRSMEDNKANPRQNTRKPGNPPAARLVGTGSRDATGESSLRLKETT